MHLPQDGKTLPQELQKSSAKQNVSPLHPATSLCSRTVDAVVLRPATRTIRSRLVGKLG